MTDVAIRVEGLSKRYRIRPRQRYKLLSERLNSLIGSAGRSVRGDRAPVEHIWALKDISFEIKRGDVVGVIGPNGAGKTTLLKILSRITEPTDGKAEVHGRVGSLLEVGTGFHPELTGRENIFLNGAILGMKKSEIGRRFDEIVQFAEIETFLDTPVKHYSSGMYMRLAFSVAAHLDPEIMLVDEVLAVGDAAFQRKCLGKMDDVAKQGRTVLFVSHNMATILSLCEKAYLVDTGQIMAQGSVNDVVEAYTERISSHAQVPLTERTDRHGSGQVRCTSISMMSAATQTTFLRCGDPLRLEIEYEAPKELVYPRLIIGIYDYSGPGLFRLDSEVSASLPARLPAKGTIVCNTDRINLSPGLCSVNIAIYVADSLADYVISAATFRVEPSDYYGSGKLFERQHSLYLLSHTWSVRADAVPIGHGAELS